MTATQIDSRTVADGVPHLCYYRRDHQLSFVWTGRSIDPVEVVPGRVGRGDPVIARLDASDSDGFVGVPGLMAWYERTCDQWADAQRHEIPVRDLATGDYYRQVNGLVWLRVKRVAAYGDAGRVYAEGRTEPAYLDLGAVVEAIRLTG